MKYLRPIKKSGLTAAAFWASAAFWTPVPAVAADGCKVILCLGGNWRSIGTCIPDVRWALRHGIPSCPGMSFSWASATNCPPQYAVELPGIDGPTLACRMTGAINVLRGGQIYQQVWWSEAEQLYRIWYSDPAKRDIVDVDPTWDADYAAWVVEQQQKQQDGSSLFGSRGN